MNVLAFYKLAHALKAQLRRGAKTDKDQGLAIWFPVDQHEVGPNMAISMIFPISG
jgi:hypothetical protein